MRFDSSFVLVMINRLFDIGLAHRLRRFPSHDTRRGEAYPLQ